MIIHQQVHYGHGTHASAVSSLHTQGVLYREHQDKEAAWEKLTEEMKREKEDLINTQLQQEVKLQEFKVS